MMNVKNMEVGFSPPYGDGIESYACAEAEFTFSPPYGDYTKSRENLSKEVVFSPPYGEGILNISQNTAKLKSRMARKYSLY